MGEKSIEITAKYCGDLMRWQNNDGTFAIIALATPNPASHLILKEHGVDPTDDLKLKGTCDLEDLQIGKPYRFFGDWTTYKNKRTGQRERQFAFRTFVPHIPRDPEGVADYLSHAGKGNGVGPSKARKLVAELGVDAVLSICRGNVADVMRIVGIDQTQAERFADVLRSQAATEDAILQVDSLLSGRKFPKTTARKAIKKWGNKAAEIISDDPYRLIEFPGVGFKLTDNLWVETGKGPSDIKRQTVCLWHHLHTDRNGHTWFPAAEVVSALRKMIGIKADPRAAIMLGKEMAEAGSKYGGLATCRTNAAGQYDPNGENLWIAEAVNAENETDVSTLVAAAESETSTTTAYAFETVASEERTFLDHVRCKRCHRMLTAATVHVLDGVPYGPTCIGHVQGGGKAEVIPLADWIDKNPSVSRVYHSLPARLIQFPQISIWPDVDSLTDISEHQRAAAAVALSSRVGILGGSPGTGKTWTVASIIKAVIDSGRAGVADIAVGAPTGKAAVRLTETLAKHGITIRARTWHSILGIAVTSKDGETEFGFQFGESERAPYRMLIGDESSMLDVGMMASIFRARDRGCHVLLVGDVNQLPPVGNGSPLRDMIRSGAAFGELRKIERNSGGIVEACAAIRDERDWVDEYSRPGMNLEITRDGNPDTQEKRILTLIDQFGADGYDPIWDFQVVAAVNEKSPLSRVALNRILQDRLNSNPKVDHTDLRIDDKTVCTRNTWYVASQSDGEANENNEVFVANGEIGKVIEFTPKHVTIELPTPFRVIQVPRYGEGGIGQWDLAYALSVHKFQGSEQKLIAAVLDTSPGARMVCDRSWIYTAISRAQDQCKLVGLPETARRMCRVQKINQRRTFLADRIALERSGQAFFGL